MKELKSSRSASKSLGRLKGALLQGGCSKTLALFFISRVRSAGFRDQFLGARKMRESAAKGRRYLIMSRPILKDETKTRLRTSKF